MGGGRRTSGDPTRLLLAGLAAAVVLCVLGTTAAAARGGRSAATPEAAVPPLVRVAGPPPDAPAPTASPARAEPAPTAKPAPPAPAPPPVATTVTAEAAPPPPAAGPVLPEGKGMWVWKPQLTDGGSPAAIVARARAVGLSHLFVRTGSSWDDFDGGPFLDKLLPAAHAAGLKVYGWDFPNFVDWQRDVGRAGRAITYRTPDGHSIDGFAADIETPSEGTRMTPPVALAYGAEVRRAVGPGVLLIAVVPRPSPQVLKVYPYDNVVASFDVIAPMVYWLNREPVGDTAGALLTLARLGKPMMPVGQAYDGGREGGRPGVPPRAELLQFMQTAKQYGAIAVSFWSWQAANAEAWDAIRDGPNFLRLPLLPAPRR